MKQGLQVLIAVVLLIALLYRSTNHRACGAGYVRIMMAPGDHCVLHPDSKKCGGHDADFSDAHHKQECVSKQDFVKLWNAGFCHYDNDTPIINRSGYIMCKPNSVTEKTVDGFFLHTNIEPAQRTGDWKRIQVNGHEILSPYVYNISTPMRSPHVAPDPDRHKVYEYLASLPGVDRSAFDRHMKWMREHETIGDPDWEKYCKDLPDLC